MIEVLALLVVGGIFGASILLVEFWTVSDTWVGKTFAVLFGIPLGGAIGGFVGGLAGLLLATVVGGFFPTTWDTPTHTELASLRSNDGASGSFFLGIGAVSDKTYYVYYTKTDDGGFVPNKLEIDGAKVRIYENAPANHAELLTFSEKFQSDWVNSIAVCSDMRYEFHVPAGTVERKFSLQ